MSVVASPAFLEAMNAFLQEYQFQISGFLGFTVLTCLLVMIIHITRLGTSGGSARNREEAIRGILVSGIGLAVLGSISVWYFLLATGVTGL